MLRFLGTLILGTLSACSSSHYRVPGSTDSAGESCVESFEKLRIFDLDKGWVDDAASRAERDFRKIHGIPRDTHQDFFENTEPASYILNGALYQNMRVKKSRLYEVSEHDRRTFFVLEDEEGEEHFYIGGWTLDIPKDWPSKNKKYYAGLMALLPLKAEWDMLTLGKQRVHRNGVSVLTNDSGVSASELQSVMDGLVKYDEFLVDNFGLKPAKSRIFVTNKELNESAVARGLPIFSLQEMKAFDGQIRVNNVKGRDRSPIDQFEDLSDLYHERTHTNLFATFGVGSFMSSSKIFHEAMADFTDAMYRESPEIWSSGKMIRNLEAMQEPSIGRTENLNFVVEDEHRASLLLSGTLWKFFEVLPREQLAPFMKAMTESIHAREDSFYKMHRGLGSEGLKVEYELAFSLFALGEALIRVDEKYRAQLKPILENSVSRLGRAYSELDMEFSELAIESEADRLVRNRRSSRMVQGFAAVINLSAAGLLALKAYTVYQIFDKDSE